MTIKVACATALSITALGLAAPAFAQDDADLWSGFYVGANAGGAWGDSSLTRRVTTGTGAIVIPPTELNLLNAAGDNRSNKNGFTGGIEGGYNYVTSNWLLGLETDFVALDSNVRTTSNFRSTISPVNYSLSGRARTSWMWSVRPRVGYVSGPWLIYATGGLAMTEVKVNMDLADSRTPQNVVRDRDSSTRTGWIAGAGAGYAVNENWSVKGEWLYADFGNISTTAVSPNGFFGLTTRAGVKSNIVRLGADYRF